MNFDKDNDENMLFYGDTGLGKSFMCNCVAKELLDKGYLVIYQTAFKMFEIIEEYKFKNSDDHITKDNYNNLFDCDLLIIDDLGTELTNSFTNSELFNILNTRLLSGKKTIISTNLSPMQLGDIYAQRIFSRIFDRFRMVKFIGNDLRWEQK
ncbi:ATP-binding protein [Paraclostridium bifermentans]|nr:ATP-binding protein [Paraclostridium bifermentans]